MGDGVGGGGVILSVMTLGVVRSSAVETTTVCVTGLPVRRRVLVSVSFESNSLSPA